MWERIKATPVITGAVLAIIGIVLAIGGFELVSLGYTWYYLLTGIALIVTGVLLGLGRREGYWLYLLVFVLTLIWAILEVGFDGWKLMPRLLAPAVILFWLSMPWITRRLNTGHDFNRWTEGRWAGAALAVLTVALVFGSGWWITHVRWDRNGEVAKALPTPAIGIPVADGDWRYYGRDQAGTRYSPLAQITPDNVGKLELAWEFHTGDLPKPGENSGGKEFNFEATPIKVGNSVYLCTPHRDIIAIDAVTGKQRWRFDPNNDTSADVYLSCRGVAYYTPPAGATGMCAERIISTTADARLFAVDAKTGKLCPGFGQNGMVNLRQNLGPTPPGFHFITSQPLVAGGKIILSGWVFDNQTQWEPSGVIRAFDAGTGRLAWAWDMGRQPQNAPLKPGEMYTRGTPNGWGTYTADEGLGLVYVPLGNATPDYFGAQRRPFDEEYASSVVALDLATGEERWHYQTVHHDVWDFDVPIGPSLVNLPDGNGAVIPALVQTTKRGEFFVLDRRTGRPIVETVEKPVPQGAVPGEFLSPTQPYPVGMPSLAPGDLTAKDVWGATPIDQMLCRIQFAKYRYEGQFTPPTAGYGNIGYPAFDGIIDWHGATIDPTRHLLIANASYIPFTYKMMKTQEAIEKGHIKPWKGWGSGQPYPSGADPWWNPQYGTPYAIKVRPWLNVLGVPCNAPPWGTLTAIDLATKKIVWTRPMGTTRDLGPLGLNFNLPLPTGMFNIGGNIVTAGGLIFVGAFGDDYLRAIDERTGEIVWKARLPAGGQATPMSYMGADGRQYIVISAGGHGGLGTPTGDAVMAYALPKRG
jgi:quinoprotein glucose dehydrogenase